MRRQTTIPREAAPSVTRPEDLAPLSERILRRLPGPQLVWLWIWALVPWLSLPLAPGFRQDGELAGVTASEWLLRAAATLAIVVSIWGAARIGRDLVSLRPKLSELLAGRRDGLEPFRGAWRVTPPIVLALATALIFGGQSLVEHGDVVRAVVVAASWVVVGTAVWSFLWVYLNLQLGLNRLGRISLSLQAYPGDRSLGLRPLGTIAFTGFWAFIGTLAPLLLAAAGNWLGSLAGAVILLIGVATFFLSLRRLNRQMVAAKQRELEWARDLYEQASAPVREERTLEALERQSDLLSGAEALEHRAERIQEWPFDEATFARVVAISSTVIAAIVARLLLAPFGI